MNTLKYNTDVLIAGGSASGTCAAIQAARLGAQVILVEETGWLGGMLTAAGVSAVDGNHRLPSGLWGEFREALYTHYGGADRLKTGWVSHACFEPRVGNNLFHNMVAAETNITVLKGYKFLKVVSENGTVRGALFHDEKGQRTDISAGITVDCTELGDVLAASGAAWRSGRESRAEYGESPAPFSDDDFIQDLTYVAILREGSPHLVEKPEGYNPERFRNCCRDFADADKQRLVSAEQMLEYGRLPNNRFMINWPNQGNDYYINALEMSPEERQRAWEDARRHTLCFVYFIQQELGFRHLGLAEEEFPTGDRLPLIPYHRESRRLKGRTTLTLNDILEPYSALDHFPFRDAVAVGDYPLDHHHDTADLPEPEVFPPIPAFSVPYGCLVPEVTGGLLVAEKSISVSHVVNGCTRLQPVVMQLGQAAGAAAALCALKGINPADLNVKGLQQTLLDAGCWLLPFNDTTPADSWFQAVQRVGLSGIMKGEPVSKDWANGFHFHPQEVVDNKEFLATIAAVVKDRNIDFKTEQVPFSPTPESAAQIMCALFGMPVDKVMRRLERRHAADAKLTRASLAVLIDAVYNPL